jgi:hypothetical protein
MCLEQGERFRSPWFRKPSEDPLPQGLDGVEHRRLRPITMVADDAERKIHQHENCVDQRERRLEEVVDVSCDVLPKLVDEPTEACTSEDRDEHRDARRDGRDGDHQRDQHHHAPPDRMRDVECPVSELWIARDHEKDSIAENPGDCEGEEEVEISSRVSPGHPQTMHVVAPFWPTGKVGGWTIDLGSDWRQVLDGER